jgi:hypothetical protein
MGEESGREGRFSSQHPEGTRHPIRYDELRHVERKVGRGLI